jgi:hypothetical protein
LDTMFNKPKTFGQILDHTFSLSKNRFKDFFLILLIFMGPVYLLQAMIELISGTSFFRDMRAGNNWFQQMMANINETNTIDTSNLSSEIGSLLVAVLVGILGAILFPVAEAAILLAIHHIRKNEEYTVGSVIRQAFSRFWPILGSTILFGLITFGIILVPLVIVVLAGVFGSFISPFLGIPLAILLFLGFAVGIGLLLTRWSFYFGSVVLENDAPGLFRSWRLTKKRTWMTMGLYIVFYLIISCVSFAVQATFSAILGNSVLLSIIVNLISLFTTLFFSVGYAIMYLDLKLRHDADDLKEMIEDYKTPTI